MMKKIILLLVTLMSFSVMAQESQFGGVPVEEYQPHGIPMGDSFKSYMTCDVVDVVVVGFKDGKTTRYSGIEDSFEVGDTITLEVQYRTTGIIPELVIKQLEDVRAFYTISATIFANDEFNKMPNGAMNMVGLPSRKIYLTSKGELSIDNSFLGSVNIKRYYKDDYELRYHRVGWGDSDDLLYFNCTNGVALTTAIDKMFDYVSKMPDNIKTD